MLPSSQAQAASLPSPLPPYPPYALSYAPPSPSSPTPLRCIQILSRRTKNNPVLIGEPGVGKTAVAEGLAQVRGAGGAGAGEGNGLGRSG